VRILFAGWHNPNFMSLTEYIERALVQLGHTIEPFEYRQFLIPGIIRDRVSFIQNYDINRINNKLIYRVGQFKPDILFVLQGTTIKPETIDAIKSRFKVITVNWYIDPQDEIIEHSLRIAKHYDHFFFSHSEGVRKNHEYGNKHVKLLYFACDPEINKPLAPSEDDRKLYESDIVFVGSHYPGRERILSSLSDMNLKIWGPRWTSIDSNSPLYKRVKGDVIDPVLWTKIISCTKIALNIHAGFNDEKKTFAQQATCRVFELLSCGCFELSDATVDLNSLFEPKKHLVTFSTLKEMKDSITYYLTNDREREKIAKCGRDEVLQKHTYVRRMKEMLDIVVCSV
jgi:spore maturation protein CgeB